MTLSPEWNESFGEPTKKFDEILKTHMNNFGKSKC